MGLEEKRLYVLAQFDTETERRLAGLYGALAAEGFTGTQTKGIPYHVTLGTFAIADEAETVRRAQAVARGIAAFPLLLAYVGLFGMNVLFIAPAVRRELLDLLQAAVPHGGTADEFPWVAHVTLLMDEPEAVRRAIPVLAKHFTPFLAKVESIGVYEFFPERKIGVYPLRA